MNTKDKMKLLKALPTPEDLEGLLPRMNKAGMVKALLTDNETKVADMTLLAMLMGTVHMLMKEHDDWGEYLDPSNIVNSAEESVTPEICDDPECEGCQQMKAMMEDAEKHGAKVKFMKLTREQAEEMGFDVDSGMDIPKHKGKSKKKPKLTLVPSTDTKH
jgi:hypothetical protein